MKHLYNNSTPIHKQPHRIGYCYYWFIISCNRFVVYLDQQTGALHAIYWSKSFVSAPKQIFCLFLSLTEKRKKKDRKVQKITRNNKRLGAIDHSTIYLCCNTHTHQILCGDKHNNNVHGSRSLISV